MHSIEDIKVLASVTNAGSEDVKVLKYGTVLDWELPTRSFTITKDGMTANFTGIKMQLDLTQADDSAFVVIPAGQTVTAEHEGTVPCACPIILAPHANIQAVAPLYDFESLGVGNYTFEPVTTFQVIDTTPSVLKVAAPTVDVAIHSDVAKRDLKALVNRATVSCSDPSKKSFISDRCGLFSDTYQAIVQTAA